MRSRETPLESFLLNPQSSEVSGRPWSNEVYICFFISQKAPLLTGTLLSILGRIWSEEMQTIIRITLSLSPRNLMWLYKMKHTLKPDYDKNEMIAVPGVCGCSQVRCPVGSSG